MVKHLTDKEKDRIRTLAGRQKKSPTEVARVLADERRARGETPTDPSNIYRFLRGETYKLGKPEKRGRPAAKAKDDEELELEDMLFGDIGAADEIPIRAHQSFGQDSDDDNDDMEGDPDGDDSDMEVDGEVSSLIFAGLSSRHGPTGWVGEASRLGRFGRRAGDSLCQRRAFQKAPKERYAAPRCSILLS